MVMTSAAPLMTAGSMSTLVGIATFGAAICAAIWGIATSRAATLVLPLKISAFRVAISTVALAIEASAAARAASTVAKIGSGIVGPGAHERGGAWDVSLSRTW